MNSGMKHQDDAFDALLAEVLRDVPTVKPSADFADMVVAALPEAAPVLLPLPKPALNPWRWLTGTAVAAALIVVSILQWGPEMLPWLRFEGAVLSFDTMLLIADIKTTIINADTSVMTVVALAAFGLIARSGTSLASGGVARG
jgi:hypothetical protein